MAAVSETNIVEAKCFFSPGGENEEPEPERRKRRLEREPRVESEVRRRLRRGARVLHFAFCILYILDTIAHFLPGSSKVEEGGEGHHRAWRVGGEGF